MTSQNKNYLIAFLLCTTLAGAGLAIQQRQLLAEAKAAPTLKVTQSNFEKRPTQPLKEARPAPVAAPAEEPAQAPAETADATGRPQGGPGQGRGNWGARMAELMKDPEFLAAMKVEQESRIEKRYGALFKQLNLPAEKTEALKNLLVERENARRDVMTTAMSEGLDPRNKDNRDQLRTLTDQMQAEVDANIKTTIGEAAYTQLETYKATQPQRAAVSDLNEKLSITSQPLSNSQAQQLTKILTDTGTVTGRNVLITDQTISVARGVLSSPQIDQLIKLQAEQAAQQLIESKTQGGGGGGGNRGNGGGNGGGGNGGGGRQRGGN
jgi:hypothetical protein